LLSSVAWANHELAAPVGEDSVDDGRIDWEDNTKYDTALRHASNTWNNVGGIVLTEDGWRIEDLEVDDVSKNVCHSSLAAATTKQEPSKWRQSDYSDRIVIFTCFMDYYGEDRRKEVLVHEFGHALGLNDIINDGPHPNQIMQRGWCYCTEPQAHDKLDYQRRWSNGDAFDRPQLREDFRNLCHITAPSRAVDVPILCDPP